MRAINLTLILVQEQLRSTKRPFVFQDSETAAGIFNNERAGHTYSRITNPTNAVLEERISSLEGGIGAISTASGQAALFSNHNNIR